VALLRKLAFEEIGAPPGRGCYWDAHELGHESTDTVLAFPEWEWADFVMVGLHSRLKFSDAWPSRRMIDTE